VGVVYVTLVFGKVKTSLSCDGKGEDKKDGCILLGRSNYLGI
jgi:hypothetical protein